MRVELSCSNERELQERTSSLQRAPSQDDSCSSPMHPSYTPAVHLSTRSRGRTPAAQSRERSATSEHAHTSCHSPGRGFVMELCQPQSCEEKTEQREGSQGDGQSRERRVITDRTRTLVCKQCNKILKHAGTEFLIGS